LESDIIKAKQAFVTKTKQYALPPGDLQTGAIDDELWRDIGSCIQMNPYSALMDQQEVDACRPLLMR
jgi:hypothetical protein